MDALELESVCLHSEFQTEKQKEVDAMRMQVKEAMDTKDKLNKIYQTNRDLVTRKCGLESAV